MAIHSRLSILMGEKRYNIQDVFERTGISRTTISNTYHDRAKRIDYGTMDKLCTLFDCTPSELFTQEIKAQEEKA